MISTRRNGGPESPGSPATLVAIAIAARRAGDRELEREARQKLAERFGVTLTFAKGREPKEARDGQ